MEFDANKDKYLQNFDTNKFTIKDKISVVFWLE